MWVKFVFVLEDECYAGWMFYVGWPRYVEQKFKNRIIGFTFFCPGPPVFFFVSRGSRQLTLSGPTRIHSFIVLTLKKPLENVIPDCFTCHLFYFYHSRLIRNGIRTRHRFSLPKMASPSADRLHQWSSENMACYTTLYIQLLWNRPALVRAIFWLENAKPATKTGCRFHCSF